MSPVSGRPLWRTRTFRRFCYAVLLMLGMTAAFHGISTLESAYLGRARVVDSAFGATMRFTGLAHFVIGFLFMVTSTSMQSTRARIHIATLLTIGIALCVLFHLAGATTAYPRIPMWLVATYFAVHEFRDEYFFYRKYGEAPRATENGRRTARLLIGLFFGAMAVAWSVQFIQSDPARDAVLMPRLESLVGLERWLWWSLPAAAFVTASGLCFISAQRMSGSTLRSMLASNRPVWAVYAGIPIVIAASALFGGRGYSIVVLHVTAWWVFASVGLAQFGKKGGPLELGWMAWFRSTQTGFQTLHIGLTAVFLGLGFAWVYGQGMSDGHPLAWVVTYDAFYYWTILHVTVSFVPKKA